MKPRPRSMRPNVGKRRLSVPDVPVVSTAKTPAPPVEVEAPREGTDMTDEAIRKMLEAAYT